MVKCDLCKQTITETFLEKIKGTYIRENGKLKAICSKCQKQKSGE